MYKAILFDADGVLINRVEYFSDRLSRDYSLSFQDQVLPFFTGDFKDCLVGKSDLKKILPNG